MLALSSDIPLLGFAIKQDYQHYPYKNRAYTWGLYPLSLLQSIMAERSRWSFLGFGRRRPSQTNENPEKKVNAPDLIRVGASSTFRLVAGLDNLFEDTKLMYEHRRSWTRTKYDDEFDLYDDMLRLDPELNGAVRTIALTANKYRLEGGKNAAIRTAIKQLTEEIVDFDDLLINGEYKKPQVLYIDSDSKVKFERLLKLRKDFIPKLKNTSRDHSLR